MNIPVIMYHSVNDYVDKHPQGFLAFSEKEFRLHLRIFEMLGYEILSLSEIFELDFSLLDKRKKIAILTFDDGFLDNLTTVAPILEDKGIKATVFINTDMLEQSKRYDHFNWGFINDSEMDQLYARGCFDIQSHTHSHNRVFVSNKVVDYYSADKFDKYYWLIWLLFPDTKHEWHGDVRRFRSIIPDGLPILENDREINQKQYIVSFEQLMDSEVVGGSISVGYFEDDNDYEERVSCLLKKPRDIVKKNLGHTMEHVCFPGGAYNKKVLEVLEKENFKSYMLSSSEQRSNNEETFSKFGEKITAVSRISFTLDYPSFIPKYISAFISVGIKLKYYEGNKLVVKMMFFMKKIRDVLR
ncbi:polysaccharide deacetylase family protein [Vibrio breoganii]